MSTSALFAAEPPLEFSGVLTTNGAARIALTDKATNTTRWLAPGEDFLGYSVVRYDATHSAVILKQGVQEYRLSLVPAKAIESAGAPATAPAPAAIASTPPAASVSASSTTAGATAAAPAPVAPFAAPPPLPGTPPAGTASAPAAAATPAPDPTSRPMPPTSDTPGYITKGGETLEQVSRSTGVPVERLKELNPAVRDASTLGSGQPLRTQ